MTKTPDNNINNVVIFRDATVWFQVGSEFAHSEQYDSLWNDAMREEVEAWLDD